MVPPRLYREAISDPYFGEPLFDLVLHLGPRLLEEPWRKLSLFLLGEAFAKPLLKQKSMSSFLVVHGLGIPQGTPSVSLRTPTCQRLTDIGSML